jgi:1,2-diacylglycerol 3-alpha-glucosyltransferase
MHVLWLTPGFAADEHDHNCLPLLQGLALALQQEGVRLSVLALGYPFHGQPYQWHGIPVRSAYGFNGRSLRWINWLRLLRFARVVHRNTPVQAIHSFWWGPCRLLGARLARQWQLPQVTTLMGQDTLPDNRYLFFLKKQHLPELVALSGFHSASLQQHTGLAPGNVIPWGRYDPFATDPPADDCQRDIDVLGCGALIPLKNWRLWLHTIALLKNTQPAIRALLLGDGVERAALEAYCRQLGLTDQVRLAGHIPRAQVMACMRRARVLLHTSGFESFGNVLIEAAESGCRVVATPVGIADSVAATASTAPDLASLVQMALVGPAPEAPFVWHDMRQTALEYLRLYRRSS